MKDITEKQKQKTNVILAYHLSQVLLNKNKDIYRLQATHDTKTYDC